MDLLLDIKKELKNLNRNELDKAHVLFHQHDSAYADHKDLINRAKSDKVLRNKVYDIVSNPEYYGYQRGLVSMVYDKVEFLNIS